MLWTHLVTDQFVREWQPLWRAQQSLVYYCPFLLLAFILLRSRRWEWIDLCVLLTVAWQAASHLRHGALLAIAMCVLLPAAASEAVHRTFPGICHQFRRKTFWPVRYAAVGAIVGGLAFLQIRGSAVLWRHGLPPWEIAVETRSGVPGVPVRAAAVMRELGLGGNLITDYGWGQFVLCQRQPAFRVAFDGRYRTVYPAGIEQEFLAFQLAGTTCPATTPMLDTHPTEITLLPAGGGPDRYLRKRGDWACLYRDDQAAVYVARSGPYSRLVEEGLHRRLSLSDAPAWMAFPALFGDGTLDAFDSHAQSDESVFAQSH
jgi:hypothetical protein